MGQIFLKATLEPAYSGQKQQLFLLLLLLLWVQLFGAVTALPISNANAIAATLHTSASSLALGATAATVTLASKETATNGAVSLDSIITKVYTSALVVERLIPAGTPGASDVIDIPIGAATTVVPVVAGANHAGAVGGGGVTPTSTTQTSFVTVIRTDSRALSQTTAPDNANGSEIVGGNDSSPPPSRPDVDDVNAAGPDLGLRAYQFLMDWWPQGLLACVILAWCVRRYGVWNTLNFLFTQVEVEGTNADRVVTAENDSPSRQVDVGNPGPTNIAHGGNYTGNRNGNGNLTIHGHGHVVVISEGANRFIQAVGLNPAAAPAGTVTAQELAESPVHTNLPGPAPQDPAPMPQPGPRRLLTI